MSVPRIPTFFTPGELAGPPKPMEWLVDGVIPAHLFGLLWGEPYAGKSLLALAWSCAIASGTEWLGHKANVGTVFYIAGEGQTGIGRRVRAWCADNGVPLENMRLYVSKYGTDFFNAEDMQELQEDMRAAPGPIALIVVDTMTRAAPGMNEDRADEVMRFIRVCEDLQIVTNAAVLVLHHTGHHDKTRAKGSISLKGAVDFEYGVVRTKTDGVALFTCTKFKDFALPSDRFLRVKPVDIADGVESAVLVECDAPTARANKAKRFKPGPNDLLFAAALGTTPQDAATVRAAFMVAYPAGTGDAAQNYLRAKKRAFGRGWFTDDGHALTPNLERIEQDGATRH